MGIVKFLTVRFVEVIVVLLLILFMPSIPPKANFTHYKVTPSQELQGKLALNGRLNGAERIYENELKGAEAFAEYNGELYTSLFTGDVVKLSKGHIVPVVKFGKPCAGHHEESICGRPLGIQFDKQGNLYAVDAYMGIWRVDLKTGYKTLLVSMNREIEGKKPMLPNSIALSENGDFYWTDSSSEFHLEDGVFSLLADGTGRLIHYNARTKSNKVLMDGLHFANGVMLSSDEEFLIVSETARSRVYRFYLKGPKAGTHDIFADGLPGMPDNINSDGQGGYFIPLIVARDSDHPIVSQSIAQFPLLRKLISRIFGLIEVSFKTMHKIYPNMYTQMAIHMVGHFETMKILIPTRVTVLHYSKTGELLEALHSTDNSIRDISDAFIFGDDLYLGSPYATYIGKLPLSKVGLEHLRKKREIPVQKRTTPPPTKATTPPPTAAPVKKAPPPPPVKQAPPPTQAPVKQTPPSTQAPVKQTPPPAQAPVKQTPPPTKAPVKQAPPPTPAPVKQVPPPKPAPVKEAPVTKQQAPPQKQTPPPAPVKQAPPPPVKQAPPPPVKQTPPAPVKQAPPAPVKEAPPTQKQVPPTAAPVREAPPTKEAPKVVPVKENAVPKSESIKQRV